MEAINRAIEDASDYTEFQRKLMEAAREPVKARNRWGAELTPVAAKFMQSPRRPGENREQHRARIFADTKKD